MMTTTTSTMTLVMMMMTTTTTTMMMMVVTLLAADGDNEDDDEDDDDDDDDDDDIRDVLIRFRIGASSIRTHKLRYVADTPGDLIVHYVTRRTTMKCIPYFIANFWMT